MQWTGNGGVYGWYCIHGEYAGRVWQRDPDLWRAVVWSRKKGYDDHEIQDFPDEEMACKWIEDWIMDREEKTPTMKDLGIGKTKV